ncbi:MAG: hypothetical protein AB7G21_14860 [Dehalococcoidia bacterium]
MTLTPTPPPQHPTSMRTRRRWLAAPAGYRSPWGTSTWTQAMMGVLCVTSILLALNLDRARGVALEALAPGGAPEIVVEGPLAFQALAGSLVLQLAALVGAATAFTLWMRRLAANLGTLVEHAVTPAEVTRACLVPLLNVVTLPRAVRGMRASTGGLFTLWWVVFAASELTLFGIASGYVVLLDFAPASQQAIAQGAEAAPLYAAWDRAVTAAILNAALVAAGAALTIALVRSTTRQHEIGESQAW